MLIHAYQNKRSLVTSNEEMVVNMQPPKWRNSILTSIHVGTFHFDTPMTNTGTPLFSVDVIMIGDMMNSKNVWSQIPLLWKKRLQGHDVIVSWKSMNKLKLVHFVTLWTTQQLDPRTRWHVKPAPSNTIKLLNECPDMNISADRLFRHGRVVGDVVRSVVVVPKMLKLALACNWCASEMLSKFSDLIPHTAASYIHVKKIKDSEHMMDCAYDVVFAYINK